MQAKRAQSQGRNLLIHDLKIHYFNNFLNESSVRWSSILYNQKKPPNCPFQLVLTPPLAVSSFWVLLVPSSSTTRSPLRARVPNSWAILTVPNWPRSSTAMPPKWTLWCRRTTKWTTPSDIPFSPTSLFESMTPLSDSLLKKRIV